MNHAFPGLTSYQILPHKLWRRRQARLLHTQQLCERLQSQLRAVGKLLEVRMKVDVHSIQGGLR